MSVQVCNDGDRAMVFAKRADDLDMDDKAAEVVDLPPFLSKVRTHSGYCSRLPATIVMCALCTVAAADESVQCRLRGGTALRCSIELCECVVSTLSRARCDCRWASSSFLRRTATLASFSLPMTQVCALSPSLPLSLFSLSLSLSLLSLSCSRH